MIKLLIVDDSAFMRMAMRKMVEKDDQIEVVGEARNGKKAVLLASRLKPDVITMDVEMPEMNGIEAVKQIMNRRPCPIIMVSSITKSGTDATIKSLANGAVDFISKSSSFVQLDIVKIETDLIEKIHHWAKQANTLRWARLKNKETVKSPPVSADDDFGFDLDPNKPLSRIKPRGKVDLVVIGVSTGGPPAIMSLLKEMGEIKCPIVIAQHMPKHFTSSFANHLAYETGLKVSEGEHGQDLISGEIIVAPGGTDSQIRQPFKGRFVLHVRPFPGITLHPSVDVLFNSAARMTRSPVGIILTGMGKDGSQGAREFVWRKFPMIAQTPESCIVDGMPGNAIKERLVSDVMDISQIASTLSRWC